MADEAKATTGTTPAAAIPENLKKFYEADGKLNVEKLSQSYLETEHMAHEATQKRADAERAYGVLAGQLENVRTNASGAAGRSGGDDDADSERPLTKADTAPVVQAFIELIHPEVANDPATGAPKDPKFWDGLIAYVKTLPPQMKQSIAAGDFQAQDWAIKQYKAARGGTSRQTSSASSSTSNGTERPNFQEGTTPGNGDGKKQWTHEEIKSLIHQNPKEYARLAETEIAEAYREGRVK
jgi:hypothetical protein